MTNFFHTTGIAKFTSCRLIIILIVLAVWVNCQGQLINGVIKDSESQKTIPLAHVFIEGTTVGEISDTYGVFHIDVTNYPNNILVFSAIGYQIKQIDINDLRLNGKDLTIYLDKTIYDLSEIKVVIDESHRRKYLKKFREQFLGISKFGRRAKIENEDSIYFSFEDETRKLTAFSNGPIIINNRSLGYRVAYWLEDFEYSPQNISYHGFAFFDSIPVRNTKRISQNRRDAFLGSIYHFIKALWHGNHVEEGYVVEPLRSRSQQDIIEGEALFDVVDFGKLKMLYLNYPIRVFYNPLKTVSYLEQISPYTLIEANGYYQSRTLKWGGAMGVKRMGDDLPIGSFIE